MKFHLPLLCLALAIAPAFVSANVIVSEDFEDQVTTYTQIPVDNTTRNGMGTTEDYFGQVDNSNIDQTYAGFGGNSFWSAQNTDGDTTNNSDNITLEWTGINIAGFTNLTFDGNFATFDNLGGLSNGTGHWDPSTSVRVQAQIDGGGFFNVLGFESINNTSTNRAVREDIDFVDNGQGFAGEGALLTDNLTLFSRTIAGTGSTLDFRINVTGLNGNGEDIAFDDISINGDLENVPEPASILLFGSALGACVLPRRRKSLFSFLSK